MAWECLFALILLGMAASPLQAHGRESRFFSKVSRTEPKTATPKAETQSQLSPSEQQGYGLFGKEEESYQYPPTTSNPTKSEAEAGKFRYGTGEKQGMSDTRFLDNGRYFENEEVKENNDGHGSYYGGDQYKGQRYVTGEKQGMSDTRFLENGRYFYDLEAEEKQNNGGYANNADLYTTNIKYEDERYGTAERQGKYNDASYDSYDSNYEKENEDEKYNGRADFGKGYDFKNTPNKFPNYEFDSIEEYEKYEQGRSHQKEYAP